MFVCQIWALHFYLSNREILNLLFKPSALRGFKCLITQDKIKILLPGQPYEGGIFCLVQDYSLVAI